MPAYIFRRLLLIVPTLFGIMLLNFLIVQAAPGGPVEQAIASLRGLHGGATAAIDGSGSAQMHVPSRAEQGIEPELLADIKTYYGFDKPASERFWMMLGNYATLDFGESFFRSSSVSELIVDRLPVSLSLGLWTTLLVYLISIPLGIAKAMRDGSAFDLWTSSAIIIGYAIPGFMFGIVLIVLFAGGSYWDVFPLRGLVSDNWEQMSWGARIADYFWHLTLPILAMVISGFASLTMLTKNSFLDEMSKQYVLTARAKGLTQKSALWKHVFRNAMLIIISGFPAALVGIFFTSSLLIEVIFSLNGLGLLGFEAALQRDYPVVFGTLFIFTLLGLVVNLIGDLTYVLVDPRIDFEGR